MGDWTIMILLVVSEICNSPLTLIALCLTVMTLSKVIISCTNAYLTSCKSHAPPNTALSSGLTEGLVMFLLSLQTGLIDMTLPQRLGAMSIILFIVAASLFQTVLEITHPVLLSLSASSRNVWSHLKVRFFLQLPCIGILIIHCAHNLSDDKDRIQLVIIWDYAHYTYHYRFWHFVSFSASFRLI